jgi:hypothetical protein
MKATSWSFIGRERSRVLFDDELRPFLARLLGWSDEQAVEVALRTLALALEHRATLVLRGEGDMMPSALTLHLHTLGGDSPFVVCDPRRRTIAQ